MGFFSGEPWQNLSGSQRDETMTGDLVHDRQVVENFPGDGNIAAFITRHGEENLPVAMQPNRGFLGTLDPGVDYVLPGSGRTSPTLSAPAAAKRVPFGLMGGGVYKAPPVERTGPNIQQIPPRPSQAELLWDAVMRPWRHRRRPTPPPPVYGPESKIRDAGELAP